MGDAGIVRNRAKITATIHHARQTLAIKGEYGSFQCYLDSLDKVDNFSKVVEDLGKRFKYVGKSTVKVFLWTSARALSLLGSTSVPSYV
jgi:hypothetical protein